MPVDNGEYVQEEGGIKGALTKPVGPLPLWVWAAVIVGGYFLFRVLRGSGSASSATTTTAPDTTGNTTDDLSGDAGSLVLGLQSQVAGLTADITSDQGVIDSLTKLAGIQKLLDKALSDKAGVSNYTEKLRIDLNTYKDRLAKCTTSACKADNTAKISETNTLLTEQLTKLTTINSTVASLQAQVNANQPPPSTNQISAPNTSP